MTVPYAQIRARGAGLSTTPVMDHAAEFLHAARLRAGITQHALAAMIGGSECQLSKWERRRTTPTIDQLAEWCAALDVRMSNLLVDYDVCRNDRYQEMTA